MKKLFNLLFIICILFIFNACGKVTNQEAPTLIQNSFFSKKNRILVAAHRGAHRNHPENSIQSIQEAITLGVDIAEIDIRETKDGHIVLMHDSTIDRTTTGSGKLADFTLAQLKKFYLKSEQGKITNQKIPQLEQIFKMVKGKIILDLDHKAGSLKKIIDLVDQYELWNQIIFFRNDLKYFNTIKKSYKNPIFMFRIKKKLKFTYMKDFDKIPILHISHHHLKNIGNLKQYVWINSLTFEDKMPGFIRCSLIKRLINKGVDIIQTDKPKWLLQYLRKKQLHQ